VERCRPALRAALEQGEQNVVDLDGYALETTGSE
jgi:hypothetical protein